jgi:hypothetical protein
LATTCPSARTVNVTEPFPAAMSSIPTSVLKESQLPPRSIATLLTALVPSPFA